LIQDETPDQPTDETPSPDEENVEPTTAPDEAPEVEPEQDEGPGSAPDETLSESTEDVPSAESPADIPADADDITEVSEERGPQPDQAEGEPEDVPAEADADAQERPRPRREAAAAAEPEVIPGAHLEPDLVLDQPAGDADGDEYAQYAVGEDGDEEQDGTPSADADAPAVRSPLELAADARYHATGKRKTAIARVILKPGSGVYTVNGKTLEEYFPRERLQTQARQPLDATGNLTRMDVVARIQGGGVSAQAGALRHGIARALVEAEPTLRTELKRRGYLTRDPREKERKKAGLKKARKRPQFSKR
jgi:small subunit ribosomal protein S9